MSNPPPSVTEMSPGLHSVAPTTYPEPQASQQIVDYLTLNNKTIVLLNFSICEGSIEAQYAFDFIHADKIIGFIPRRKYPYLDYGVYDTFRDIPELKSIALKIERGGIYLMGYLVQMSEGEVQSRFQIDDATLTAMKTQLSRINFTFGMRAPGWSEYDPARTRFR